MMHRGWLYTALCRNSRPSSYPFREPKHKAFHLARIIREPFSRIMRASEAIGTCTRSYSTSEIICNIIVDIVARNVTLPW